MIALLLSLLAAEPRVDCQAEIDPALCGAVERACADVAAKLVEQGGELGSASVQLVQLKTFADLQAEGHRSAYEVAVYRQHQILLAPSATLAKTPELDGIYRHECAHAWLRAAGVPALPILLEEAAAMLLAGQTGRLPPAPALDDAALPRAARAAAKPSSREVLVRALAQANATYGAVLRAALRERRLVAALKELSSAPKPADLDRR